MKTGLMASAPRLFAAMGLAGLLMFSTVTSHSAETTATTSTSATTAATASVLQLLSVHPTTAAGQSATQLADGTWLLLGGGSGSKTSAAAWQVDAKGGTAALASSLSLARSGHTATLLPGGSVLVIGGTTADGVVTDAAESFNPSSGTFSTLGAVGLLARTGHTVTVLSDGRLLIAGGVNSKGAAVRAVELYDPVSGAIERVSGTVAREQHVAALLPSGGVLLWGGTNANGKALTQGEVYDTTAQRFSTVTAEAAAKLADALTGSAAPTLVDSLPLADAMAVPVSQRLMVRFSKRMDVSTLSSSTVTLVGPNGAVKLNAVGVESGVLLFVTPQQELLPDSSFTLFIQGAKDQYGQALPMQAIGFKTAALTSSTKSSTATATTTASATADTSTTATTTAATTATDDDDERWVPNKDNYKGNWTSGRRSKASRTMPKQAALKWALHGDESLAKLKPADVAAKRVPRGPKAIATGTAITGQVLKLNGKPLANVTLSMGERRARTDANGEFTLGNVASGHQILVIDGSSANTTDLKYGRYEYGMEVTAGEVNVLPFVSWMTPLDMEHAITIPSPTTSTVVLTNPAIPGLELRIPAGTVIRDSNGKIVTQLSLTAIPVDQPPFPLPSFPVPVYFTVQPGGSQLVGIDSKSAKGAQLIYPNFSDLAPGTRVNFWDYDATSRGWFMYGQGAVTADGTQVMPDDGVVIYEFTGAMIAKPEIQPSIGPDPDSCECGDPVDMFTGLFLNSEIDLTINDVVPIIISRTFRPADEQSRAFGIGTSLNYDTYLVGDTFPYTYQNLVLENGGHIYFKRTSAGTGYSDAVYQSQDYSGGIYTGAILKWDTSFGGATWSVTLRDGTVFYYPESYNSYSYRVAAAVAFKDRFGNLTTLTRSNGNLTRITSPNGRKVNLAYDGANRVVSISDDIGRIWRYSYDAQGRLILTTDPAGYGRQYSYESKALDVTQSMGAVSSSTNMVSVVDKRGNTMVYNEYDAAGRVVKQTYADGTTNTFSYSLKTVVSVPRGVYAASNTATKVVSSVDVTDERGTLTRLSFDDAGKLVKKVRAVGLPEEQVWVYSRDASTGQLNSETDPAGRTTSYIYDAVGNLIKTTYLVGTANESSVSATVDTQYSRTTSITDQNGNVTKYQYDAFGNLVSAIAPVGDAQTYEYDGQGRLLVAKMGAAIKTSREYSGPDLVAYVDALGNRVEMFPDAIGRVSSFRDPLGNVKHVQYDALGRVVQSIDPKGGVAKLTYDENDNVVASEDENKVVTSYKFDSRNRQYSWTDAHQMSSSTTFELGGTIKQTVNRNGELSSVISIDALGRPVLVGFGATVSAPDSFRSTMQLSWDKSDRLTKIVDSNSGVTERTYDDNDQILSEATPQGTVKYTYDAIGRRTSMKVDGHPQVDYKWDAGNHLILISQAANEINGEAAQDIKLDYDGIGRRVAAHLPNGVIAEFSYDEGGRVTSIVYRKSDGVVLRHVSYAYDESGNIISSAGDLNKSILDEEQQGLEFDATGRLVSRNGDAFEYDANGNLVRDEKNQYSWDERGRLVGVKGEVEAIYGYDSQGRRIYRSTNGLYSFYKYDGLNVVESRVGDDKVILFNGLGLDEIYAAYSTSRTGYFLKDAVGSIRLEVNSEQSVVSEIAYSPYGVSLAEGVPMIDNAFTGRESDNNGLYYYRARYYRPQLGRFISEDPIGWQSGQTNRYAYVNGNPIGFADPLGQLIDIPESVVNAVAGVGDGICIGNFCPSKMIRESLDIDGGVDPCSAEYGAGKFAGSVYTSLIPVAGRIGYISRVRAIPKSVSSVEEAYYARAAIKDEYRSILRGVIRRIDRDPSLEQVMAKAALKGDAHAIARAGVTNAKVDGAVLGSGAILTARKIINGVDCGCAK